MAIELPGPAVDFLGILGISWPEINEDKVKEFGEHVAAFGEQLKTQHQNASDTIEKLTEAYKGTATKVLVEKWNQMAESHINELITGCEIVHTACDVGYGTIIGLKSAAIAQLVVMAAEFIAAQAELVITFGASEAIMVAVEAAGRVAMKLLIQEVENVIIEQIINAAFNPLIDKVGEAVQGLVFTPSSGTGAAGDSVELQPAQARELATQVGGYGDQFAQSAQTFASTTSGMSFE